MWGPEGRNWDAVALGPAAKPRLANGKEENECPKHGGKISVLTCLPLRVLENIVVSDAMGKDVIFPIGINITEGGMNAGRHLSAQGQYLCCGGWRQQGQNHHVKVFRG